MPSRNYGILQLKNPNGFSTFDLTEFVSCSPFSLRNPESGKIHFSSGEPTTTETLDQLGLALDERKEVYVQLWDAKSELDIGLDISFTDEFVYLWLDWPTNYIEIACMKRFAECGFYRFIIDGIACNLMLDLDGKAANIDWRKWLESDNVLPKPFPSSCIFDLNTLNRVQLFSELNVYTESIGNKFMRIENRNKSHRDRTMR